jgi:N-acetylglucosamine-6-phosphate deacetylase
MNDRSHVTGRVAPRRLILTNGKVITPFRTISRGGLAIENGLISAVFSGTARSADIWGGDDLAAECAEIIDVGGRVIAPGFIDIHVHGGGGSDVMDGGPDSILTMAQAHARGGSTSIVPTTTTSSIEDLLGALDSVRLAMEPSGTLPSGGANILGLHLEGPYLSTEQKGAQDPRHIKTPNPVEYGEILDYSKNILRMSVAPELPGAMELGSELRRRGILPSIGHTDATYDQMIKAVEFGYSHVTHLFSGMSGVRRVNAYRIAGAIESSLLLDDLTVEIIADGRHLPPSLIQLTFRCKGSDKIALVTDAMRAAGMPDGSYKLGSLKDGQTVIVEDGVAKLPDRSSFAGSVATMSRSVRTATVEAGIPLLDALKMATVTPARIIGVDRSKGVLSPGKDADVVIFAEDDISVWMTIVGGQVVFSQD